MKNSASISTKRGLWNYRHNCYLNCCVQQIVGLLRTMEPLFKLFTEEITPSLLARNHNHQSAFFRGLMIMLAIWRNADHESCQNLLQNPHRLIVLTVLRSPSIREQIVNGSLHIDAAECMQVILELMSDELRDFPNLLASFNNLFTGQFITMKSNVMTPFSIVTVPIESVNNLEDALSQHFNNGGDRINVLPTILMIQLNRIVFDQETKRTKKLRNRIAFPSELILPDDIFHEPHNFPIKTHILKGVIYHVGERTNFGHYIADRQCMGSWIRCDDTEVTDLEETPNVDNIREVLDPSLLVYVRQEE